MEIKILDDSENILWDKFVDSLSSNIYDTNLWQLTLGQVFDNIQNHKIVIIKNKQISAGLSLFETRSFLNGDKLSNAPFNLSNSVLVQKESEFVLLIEYLLKFAE